jgi:hypothetical protein
MGPKEFALDPEKLEAFLFALSHTRVKEFVKGQPNASQGHGDPKEMLHVVLTINNHPGIILAFWGPADGGASFYATTSLRPASDPVIKLDAATFKAYKESSGAFAK